VRPAKKEALFFPKYLEKAIKYAGWADRGRIVGTNAKE
jgi:hypothetical protein